MTDIARLGFSAQTGDLKKAKADLDALVPSATKAEQATNKFNRAAAGITTGAKGASVGIRSFDAAATGATAAADRLSKTALSAGTAMSTVQRTAAGIKPTFDLVSAGAEKQITKFDILRGRISALVQGLTAIGPAASVATSNINKIPAAADRSTSALNRLGAAANDNINRLQSTPGNIAAQFQDIGVTAAGGMNPMLIALQQGTQLSSAMQGGIGNLLAGFRQLFSFTTILTVGLVGLAAAGLQNVDWMGLATTLLNGLANAMDFLGSSLEKLAPLLIYVGVAGLIAFGPAIYTAVLNLAAAIIGKLIFALGYATAAMIAFAAANPFGFIVIAIGLVIAAMIALNDTFDGVFSDALGKVRDFANYIINSLVGAYKGVKAAWSLLPAALGDITIRAANAVIGAIEKMVVEALNRINPILAIARGLGFDITMGAINFGRIDNPYAGAEKEFNGIVNSAIQAEQGIDRVGQALSKAKELFGAGADMLRGLIPGADGDGASKGGRDRANAAISESQKMAQAYDEIVKSAQKRVTALTVESNALTMSTNAAHLYRIEQELLAQAVDKGVKLTSAQTNELKGLAAQISKGELNNAFVGMLKNIDSQERAFSDVAAQIGKYGYELEYVRQLQNLMNEAVDKGVIDLDNMTESMRLQVAMLENRAAALAGQAQGNREAEFVSDATKAHQERMFALQREAGELRLTGVALEAYRLESDLLVSAMRQGIELTPETVAGIKQQSLEYAQAEDAVRKYREEVEFHRETFKGFFTDMVNGLRQGQSVWESFGNAVLNVVNKIIDRLLDMGTNSLLDKLIGLGGSLFGASPQAGLAGDAGAAIDANPGLFAAGGAFGSSGQIHAFAKGGAFTNGVYDSPTLFKFAKGGAMGVMGEAGPEAVMPLKRGPDGSLGVQMNGPQVVQVQIGVNDDRFNAYVDERAGNMDSQNAPVIAEAGSQIAVGRSSALQRRSLT